jgi:tRNA pseudouridine38-40 synthase
MRQAINAHLPSDVRVIAIERAEVGFHARFSARSRAYRYLIENGPHASPLLRRHVWHVSSRLDVGAMQEACLELVGLHDFVAFAAREASGPTIRRVFSARIDVLPATPWVGRQGDRFTEMWHNPLQLDLGESLCGRLLSIEIEANAFLRHMMRRIVGSLVRVGRGWMHPSELGSVLHRRVKADAGPAAPAHGLDLFRVGYDGANIEDMGRCDSA